MRKFFSSVRGLVAVTSLHIVSLVFGGPVVLLILRPLALVFPAVLSRVIGPVSSFYYQGVLFFLRLGGARIEIRGRIPAGGPNFILMNHQSVLDIPVAVLAARPRLPAFITRKRYARGIPFVSPGLRHLRWPIIDPDGDPAAAFKVLASAVRIHPSLLLFPESHRSLTGEIGPFFPAGLWVLFKTERRPVYLIVGDGFRSCSHWRDLFTSLPSVRGEAEVLGPFLPPAPEGLRDFIAELERMMTARLAEMRRRRAGS